MIFAATARRTQWNTEAKIDPNIHTSAERVRSIETQSLPQSKYHFEGEKREKTCPDTEEATRTFVTNLIDEIQSEKQTTFEDGRITKAYFDRLKIIELGCLGTSILAIGLSVIQYELEFYSMKAEWNKTLLYIIFFASLILAMFTVVRYFFHMQFKKKRNLISQKETLFSTGEYRYLILEIMLVMVIPYPWLQGIIVYASSLYDGSDIYYHLNEILMLFSAMRMIIVLRAGLISSTWNSNRSQRLCEMYAVEPGILFTLRCVMETNPFFLIFVAYLGSIPFFGYMLRIAEQPMNRVPDNPMLFDYANSMWNIIITMTTVGYGDYYAKTALGRTVIFMVSIWGTTVVSLMVVTLTNIFQMSRLEGKAFHVLNRLSAREILKNEAAYVVTNLVRAKLNFKKTGLVPMRNVDNLKRHLKAYNHAYRMYREMSDSSSGFEEMESQFEFLRAQVKSLHHQQNFIVESNKLVMRVLGIDPKVAQKLSEYLRSTHFGEKQPEPASQPKSVQTVQPENSVNQEAKHQIPFFASINESPGLDPESKI